MEAVGINTMPHEQQSQQHGEYLEGVEILGESKHLNRIRKLFEHSSVKIKVVQDKPSVQDAFTWDTREPYDGDEDGALSPTQNLYGSSDENSSGLGMYISLLIITRDGINASYRFRGGLLSIFYSRQFKVSTQLITKHNTNS